MLLAGLCDFLDGQVAREGRKETKFGALLDSTTDRYSEIFVYFGIGTYLIHREEWLVSGVLFFALSGSLMVSYVRARAGGLRVDCEVGVFTRPERVAAMGAGLMAGQWLGGVLLVVLGATAGLTALTTVQRVLHVRRELEGR